MSAASLLAALACQDVPTRELGYTDDSQNLTQAQPQPSEPFATDVREFAGRWVGEAEDSLAFGAGEGEAPIYRFPSGSTRIVLELTVPTDGDVEYGSITFGVGAPPAPPSDPDLGYPADVDYADLLTYFPDYEVPLPDRRPFAPTEGYAYPIYRQFFLNDESPGDLPGIDDELFGAAPDGVLQVNYNTNDLLAPWCELQTPFPYVEGTYHCIPGTTWQDNGDGTCTPTADDPAQPPCPYDLGNLTDAELEALQDDPAFVAGCTPRIIEYEPVDCDKALLCSQERCACNSAACYVDTFGQSATNLTLRITGDTLVGELGGGSFLNERGYRVPLGTVRFHREP